MNALNRLVMLVLALLLVTVPVLLLLVAFDVIPPNLADRYTGYRAAVDALGGLSASTFAATGVRVAIGAAGTVLALITLLLLLRELTFGRRIARSALIEDEPGKETRITAGAVKALVEGAAGEAGAASASVSLATKKGSYRVACDVRVPRDGNLTETATKVRENVLSTLRAQEVPMRDVKVTVRGVES